MVSFKNIKLRLQLSGIVNFMLICFSIVMITLFVACKPENDDHQVPKIGIISVNGVSEGDTVYAYRYHLEYDEEGRIRKAIPDNDDIFGWVEFEYPDNGFIIRKRDLEVVSRLNDAGHIESCISDYLLDDFIGEMTYDNQQHLILIKGDGDKQQDETLEFFWEKDNMVKLHGQGDVVSFTYTNIENKNRFSNLMIFDQEDCTLIYPFFSLLGKPSSYLPESMSAGDSEVRYQYEMNQDGFVDEVIMLHSDDDFYVSYRFEYK